MELPGAAHIALVSGDFDVLLLVHTADNRALRELVLTRLQAIPEVLSTRTLLVFEEEDLEPQGRRQELEAALSCPLAGATPVPRRRVRLCSASRRRPPADQSWPGATSSKPCNVAPRAVSDQYGLRLASPRPTPPDHRGESAACGEEPLCGGAGRNSHGARPWCANPEVLVPA